VGVPWQEGLDDASGHESREKNQVAGSLTKITICTEVGLVYLKKRAAFLTGGGNH